VLALAAGLALGLMLDRGGSDAAAPAAAQTSTPSPAPSATATAEASGSPAAALVLDGALVLALAEEGEIQGRRDAARQAAQQQALSDAGRRRAATRAAYRRQQAEVAQALVRYGEATERAATAADAQAARAEISSRLAELETAAAGIATEGLDNRLRARARQLQEQIARFVDAAREDAAAAGDGSQDGASSEAELGATAKAIGTEVRSTLDEAVAAAKAGDIQTAERLLTELEQGFAQLEVAAERGAGGGPSATPTPEG
jgi:hypothetical protein